MEYAGFQGNDELGKRFTVWLKIVVKRAKIDYIRRNRRQYVEVSIEKVAIADTLVYEQKFDVGENLSDFDFENGKMAAAFAKLSPKRKEILVMLFVKNLTSEEIAEEWNCSLQYVYTQRSVAIKKLKEYLEGQPDGT